MSVMVGGCETTEEDRFVYSQDVQDAITRTLGEITSDDRMMSMRTVLELFAWRVVRIRENAE